MEPFQNLLNQIKLDSLPQKFNLKSFQDMLSSSFKTSHHPEVLGLVDTLRTGGFERGDETGSLSIFPGGFGINAPLGSGRISGNIDVVNQKGNLNFNNNNGLSLGIYAGDRNDPQIGAQFNIPFGRSISPTMPKSNISDNRPVEDPNYASLEINRNKEISELLDRLRGRY
jgi:hypothetical protein